MAFKDALQELKNDRDKCRQRILRVHSLLGGIDTDAMTTSDKVRLDKARESLIELWGDML